MNEPSELIFKQTTVIVEIVPIFGLRIGSFNWLDYKLPDMSYGDFLILQNRLPKFYFRCFDEDGKDKELTKHLAQDASGFQNGLIKILTLQGHENLSITTSTWFSLSNWAKVGAKDFNVSEIIDFKNDEL